MCTNSYRPPKPILLAALLLLGGITLGFFAGRLSESPDHGDSAAKAKPTAEIRPSRSPGVAESALGSTGGKPSADFDGVRELRHAIDVPDPVVATQRFAAALRTITPTEAAAAAKALWARPGSSGEMNERKRLLGYRWGQIEGAKAVEFAQARTGQGKVTAISAALAGWASVDPAAAKAWIDAQADPRIRQLYDFALVDGWARNDLAGATEHVLALSDPDQPNNARMMRIVAGEQVRQDPAGAGPWALGLPEGPPRTTAVDEVATRWVWADPTAAIDWITQIPETAGMQATMNTAMGIWTRTNPEAASIYLNEMPDGAPKDHAVGAFSRAAAPEDPEASAIWAATISDAALREESLVAVGQAWWRNDPESARVWLAQSGLSQDARDRIKTR